MSMARSSNVTQQQTNQNARNLSHCHIRMYIDTSFFELHFAHLLAPALQHQSNHCRLETQEILTTTTSDRSVSSSYNPCTKRQVDVTRQKCVDRKRKENKHH